MPIAPNNIVEVFGNAKDEIENVLNKVNLTVKSGGTRDLSLSEPVSATTGYWANPSSVISKPKRWIIQIAGTPPKARLATDPANPTQTFSGADVIGYINNRDNSTLAVIFRIMPSIMAPSGTYEFPGWEWLLVIAFDKPLPQGTSGDRLDGFNPSVNFKALTWGAGSNKRSIPIGYSALVCAPPGPSILPAAPAAPTVAISYSDATDAIEGLLFPGSQPKEFVFDGANSSDLVRMANAIQTMMQSRNAKPPVSVSPISTLVGIPPSVYRQVNAALATGKRHLIFYGPPGTGKTTLAEHIANDLGPNDGKRNYKMLTASTSWSGQDLIGGYQPMGPGKMGFIPGALLRHFDRPLVIDELNRCPIDKVIGPLFSILSGQSTTLPYRVDVSKEDSEFYVILPEESPFQKDHEFSPKAHWRMICTLNTIDKTQLGQISYALSRRFAWIKIGVPESLDDFVVGICAKLGLAPSAPAAGSPNPVAAMWKEINAVREIGGAPIIDMLKGAKSMDSGFEFFATPARGAQEVLLDALRMFVLPLMDGLSRHESEELSKGISAAWSLPDDLSKSLAADIADLAS